MTDQEGLEALLRGNHPCIRIATYEENEALDLIFATAVELQRQVLIWTETTGLRDGLLADSACLANTEHPAAALFHLRSREQGKVAVMLDLAGHLKDEKTRRLLREVIDGFSQNGGTIILVDDEAGNLPASIRAVATPFELSLPDEKALAEVFKQTIREYNRGVPVQVNLNAREVEIVLRNLSGLTRRQARQIIADCICTDRRLDPEDINTILANKRRQFQGIGLLEYIEAPVDLQDIGGLASLKCWLAQRSNALSSEATAFGIPAPRGILMLGVQGAGKSLAAKAVATAWQRPLLRSIPAHSMTATLANPKAACAMPCGRPRSWPPSFSGSMKSKKASPLPPANPSTAASPSGCSPPCSPGCRSTRPPSS
jgi:hypothetical protein